MSPTHGLRLEVRSGERAGVTISPELPCDLGRRAEASLHLPDSHLSSDHGRLDLHRGAIRYVDRGSSNGSIHVRQGVQTPLDHLCPEAELWDGDELWLGDPSEPVIIAVHLPRATDIVASRAIDEVDAFADRVMAEPRRLGVLYQHTRALGESADLHAVLDVAAAMIFELLPAATHVAVALKERGGRFPVVSARGRDGSPVEIPLSRTLVQQVIEDRAGVLITDAATELAGARSVIRSGLASVLAVPLWTGAEVQGVLQVDNRDQPGLFSGDDLEVLTVAAGHISFAAHNARLMAQLQHAEQRLDRENRYLKGQAEAATYASGIIGDGPAMQALLQGIERVKDTRVPVVITGETGTGKELVARALHYTSNRREGLFVAQNCSTLPEHLLESELFGHMRGAFTGADRDKKGLFELADGGTMFLDEIGEMPSLLQAKLLRVLQEGEIQPVGAPRPKRIDVRVVSATHRDLQAMVKEGSFREDLFYRLHVYPLQLPALRARREDIPALARHFVTRYAEEFMRPVSGLSTEALQALQAYDWPGNVRQLQNEIQRALIGRLEGDLLLLEDLSPQVRGQGGLLDHPEVPQGTLKEMLEAVERLLLARALASHDQNKTRTAEALGITREGLHKKLARFGMK
ncbi:MAG: sigma 54-interacting transcriptional regulator [Bradymonadia bacterium]